MKRASTLDSALRPHFDPVPRPGALERSERGKLVAVPGIASGQTSTFRRQRAAMRILMVTDAWRPQVNGVVHTLERLAETLKSFDVAVDFPDTQHLSHPALAYLPRHKAGADHARPRRAADRSWQGRPHPHRYRGPLGIMARRYCRNAGRPFHHQLSHALSRISQRPPAGAGKLGLSLAARFPQFPARARWSPPSRLPTTLRRAASPSCGPWTRGGRHQPFPAGQEEGSRLPRPDLPLRRSRRHREEPPGLPRSRPARSKVIVRRGSRTCQAQGEVPAGAFPPRPLAPTTNWPRSMPRPMSSVFPSRTEPFGNVIIEALASGTPVAAYPVTGPIDIVGDGFWRRGLERPCARPRSPPSRSTAPRRESAPCATAGSLRGDVSRHGRGSARHDAEAGGLTGQARRVH